MSNNAFIISCERSLRIDKMRMNAYYTSFVMNRFCAFYVIKGHILTINLFFAYNREVRFFLKKVAAK